MDDLREYRIMLNGHETTAMLNAADAKRLDGVPVEHVAPAAQTAIEAPVVTIAARPTVPNVARTTGRPRARR